MKTDLQTWKENSVWTNICSTSNKISKELRSMALGVLSMGVVESFKAIEVWRLSHRKVIAWFDHICDVVTI